MVWCDVFVFFIVFLNDAATTEFSPLSLPVALPVSGVASGGESEAARRWLRSGNRTGSRSPRWLGLGRPRKSSTPDPSPPRRARRRSGPPPTTIPTAAIDSTCENLRSRGPPRGPRGGLTGKPTAPPGNISPPHAGRKPFLEGPGAVTRSPSSVGDGVQPRERGRGGEWEMGRQGHTETRNRWVRS